MDALLIRNVRVLNRDSAPVSLLIRDGVIAAVGRVTEIPAQAAVVDANGAVALPGLVDVHVHLREPGFEYKETIASGTRAAAAGGFTTVCSMPNLKPAPDSPENLKKQLDIIARDALVEVLPYGTITKGRLGHELVDYAAMVDDVAAFSDDGSGVDDEMVMRRAMEAIAPTGKILAEHCEVRELVKGGYIHEGSYASAHGHRGISSRSEWQEVERNIRLAEETGCPLHICHVSTAESVALVREAKARGLRVTCETGAHYLAFCDEDLQEEGRFKMNPPLRGAADREALLQGCADGTIDVIASDHAPHAASEKDRGLEKSAMGVTGLELSLPAVYTYAVLPGHITFSRMVEMMATAPRRIFGIHGGIEPGERADVTLVDFDSRFTVEPTHFMSEGKATPFEGVELQGRILMTVAAGRVVYTRL